VKEPVTSLPFPDEWLERVPAAVFACLIPGELQIIIHPGNGHLDGGVSRSIPADRVPPHLRLPNTRLWIRLDRQMNILDVWQREED
jgi:hypothetical protein